MSLHSRRRSTVAVLIAALALASMLFTALATAELSQHGNLFIRFDGGIAPTALPRHQLAPISVRIEGTVRTPSGDQPPPLERIEIDLNRAGKLSAVGLPTCPRSRIETATPTEALTACGSALVGSGGMIARTSLPDQTPTSVRGEILLFNGTDHGHPAILGHVYESKPTPLTLILTFKIRRHPGTFGTAITTTLPHTRNNRSGYLKSIFLQLERRYRFHGQERSYLSAACSAPAGFSAASFPFAKASMSFDRGPTFSSTLVRSCRVR